MKVSGSPPIYCFLLLNYLNLVAQFDKLLPRNSEKFWSTPEDQTERKNDRFETPRPIQNASEISRSGQNFGQAEVAVNVL